MKQLIVDIKPASFTYNVFIYDNETHKGENVNVDNHSFYNSFYLANFAIENNIDEIVLVGNKKYTQNVQQSLEYELKKINKKFDYNVRIKVSLQEI